MGEEGQRRPQEPRSYCSQKPHLPLNHGCGLTSGLREHDFSDAALRDPLHKNFISQSRRMKRFLWLLAERPFCRPGLSGGPFLLVGPVHPSVPHGGVPHPPYGPAITATRPVCGSCGCPCTSAPMSALRSPSTLTVSSVATDGGEASEGQRGLGFLLQRLGLQGRSPIGALGGAGLPCLALPAASLAAHSSDPDALSTLNPVFPR